MIDIKNPTIAVIGLGYVGLPLALAFGKKYQVIGYDENQSRVQELILGLDKTNEVEKSAFEMAKNLRFASRLQDISCASIFIIAVPTPIDENKIPDLNNLFNATIAVGSVMKSGDIVIYESTVYPGCTEEDCVPILERVSGLVFNQDFTCGYSPERINPGDKNHRLETIVKVTSGSTPSTADYVDALYASVVHAGTHKTKSIRIAEAAKIIENTQRDVNIALINELTQLFDKLQIDSELVLQAAETKWNFIPFRPGLVGGHCIGVDPYYLTYKAREVGYEAKMILAGREVNDGMGFYFANQLIDKMTASHIPINGAHVLLLGLAFKEDCPDLRNTKVIDVIDTLRKKGCAVDVCDPLVDRRLASEKYDIELIDMPTSENYDAVMICVAHSEFRQLSSLDFERMLKNTGVIYDVKHIIHDDNIS